MSSTERADNTSLVPQYSFSETLAEQESELQANPLLQRLLAYRGRYEGDPHRPIYHYVNPEQTGSTTRTDSVSGKAAGISFTRPIRPKTRGSTGATRSATI